MADEDSDSNSGYSENDSDQEVNQDYNDILDRLVYSGQIQHIIMTSDYTIPPNTLKIPKFKYKPNTTELNMSEYAALTKLASGETIAAKSPKSLSSKNMVNMITNREMGLYKNNNFSQPKRCGIGNNYLPNELTILDGSTGKAFCGIFSKDGENFLTASQDRKIRLYDSTDPHYKLIKTLRARDVGWSIIDVAFSPDRRHFVYSTWSSALHLCSTEENNENQEPLTLFNSGRRSCIFSVVFSSNGSELLCGANDGALYIYNRERLGRTLRIPAHKYDVNSVRFSDDSCQIIYSGGDDGLVKVWDRRTLDVTVQAKPVGCFAGHTDGITFIDSRDDGRHLISNSKDQSIKLWDIRVFSGERAIERSFKAVHDQTWDYRWQEVPRKLYGKRPKIEGDTSIMTYRGHVIIKTLVRCRFSPVATTGQRYIYTGCGLGRIVIYDSLTGKIKQTVQGHAACVRDVDWHPTRNEIISSSWDGVTAKWRYLDPNISEECVKYPSRESELVSLRRSVRLASKVMDPR